MKRFYFSKPLILLALLFGCTISAIAQAPLVYTYNGLSPSYTYTVEPGVVSVVVDASGAEGGQDYFYYGTPGYGGRVQCTLAVTTGQVLNLYVGGVGGSNVCCGSGAFGGFNGGGNGGSNYYSGGGGGGATDIRVGGQALSNRLVVAGGGGGSGYGCSSTSGGAGGGTTGGGGVYCGGNTGTYGGNGGTQSAGGTGGSFGPGGNGSFGTGGNGYSSYGAGGGGGYYGGGGGYWGGGGGGSSYTDPTLATGVTHTQGYNSSGNGQITLNRICVPPGAITTTGLTNICGSGVSTRFATTGGPGGGWYSSNPSVATVTNIGVVTSLSPGTTIISYGVTYICGSSTGGTVTVTVNPLPGAISPANPTVCQNATATLSDATTGGTWSSSNSLIASINSSSGAVSGLFSGTANITYTAPTGCTAVSALTVNASPAPIGGIPSVCVGQTTVLTNGSPGGVWSTGGAGVATVNASGTVFGSAGGTAPIRYTFSGTGCQSSVTVTVNTLPTTYSVTEFPASGQYCAGGSGVDVGMSGTDLGINYQLYNGPLPVGTAMPGTTGSISFGNITAAATYSVLATSTVTGCSSAQTGTAPVIVNPLPNMYTLAFLGGVGTAGGAGYCNYPGATGLDLQLSGSDAGVLYYLYFNSVNTGSFLFGTGAPGVPLDFGYQTLEGDYSVVAVNASTGCQTNIPLVHLSIYQLPDIYNTIGGGNYCAGGTGKHVEVDYSELGVNYTLYNGATSVTTLPGANSTLDFGFQTAAGTYTVIGTNAITTCSVAMNSSATVGIYSLPTQYTLSSPTGGAYCMNGSGADITLANSDFGINYQLYNGSMPVGPLVSGGTSPLDLGDQPALGTYTAVGIDATTGCTQNMTGSVTVSTLPLPNSAFTVTGTGSYCASGTGLTVGTSGSQTGVQYLLYNGGATAIDSLAGTGGTLSFPNETASPSLPTVYTIVAANATTRCAVDLTGSATITQNPLPVQNDVLGGGDYCAGGAGKNVYLSASDLGISYQLYRNGSMFGSPVAGTGSSLSFGYMTGADTFTVIGRNTLTNCTNSMNGSAVVTIDPLPTVYTVTGSGGYCSGGSGRPVTLSGSNTGISYQLYNNGMIVNSPMPGTGTVLNFGMFTDPGTYTIVATNTGTTCTANMASNAIISVNPLPTAYNVTGGGDYCAGGAGVHVGIASSTPGVSYQLWNSGMMVGTAVAGTGSAIDFGMKTASGNYTVTAANGTTLCTNTMNGSATVVVDPMPSAFNVTGGGTYCAGGTGVHVGLNGSSTGINYQLMMGATAVGSPVSGVTGSSVDFGTQTAAGTYSVVATNSITGCTGNMSGNRTVTVASLPVVYTVTGGGAFCAGSAGAHVDLSGSATGVSYQLTNAGANVGSPVMGTGSILDFGPQTASGSYGVVATNAAGCTSNMAASATVTANPLPLPYAISGGGSFCAGGTGVDISLLGSGLGVNYQLFVGSSPTGLPIGGTGRSLDFGMQTGAGIYKIIATNTTTGCTSTMDGTSAVTVTPLLVPAVTVSSSMGDTVCAGIVSTFSASVVNGGSTPTVFWLVNGTYSGGGSTFSDVAANGDNITAVLVSSAACTTTDTVMATKVMTTRPYVLPAATITGSTPNVVCPGTPVTFSAVASNQGPSPVYTWYKNSNPVGTGTTYTDVPVNNDIYVFRVISDQVCRSTDTVFSNTIKMTTQTEPAPVFGITSHLSSVIGVGLVDSLWATVTAGGANLSYQWFVNGVPVHGATSSRYVASPIFNGDSIACVVTSVGPCGGTSASGSKIVYLVNEGVTQVNVNSDIRVSPNPNKGFFTVKGTLGTTADAEVTIEVTNMLGQTVYSNKVVARNGELDEHVQLGSTLANGMYMLTLKTGTDSKIFHIVVEK